MNSYRNFSGEYKKNSIETASPLRLVVLLYEGAIKFIDEAIDKMSFETYDQVNHNIARAKDIVVELQTSLNFEEGGEISSKLSSLYLYVLEKLREGNMEKKSEPLLEAKSILKSLLDSWHDVEALRKNNNSVEAEDSGSFLPDDLSEEGGFSIEG